MKTHQLTDHRLDATAKLHALAFKDSLSTKLGPRYIKALLKLHADHPDGIALVAVDNDQVVGYVVGSHVKLPFNEVLLGTVVRCVLAKPWLLLNRQFRAIAYGRIGDKCRRYKQTSLKPVELPTVRLLGIGVAPSHQCRGIAKQLMTDFECIAADRYREPKLVLSVDKYNVPANALYRKQGWRVFKQDGQSFYYDKVLA